MKTFTQESDKIIAKNNWRFFSVFFALMVLFAFSSIAQSTDFTQDALKTQEELQRNEFMSYVYMVLGFVFIIGIAWFSVKNKKEENDLSDKPPVLKHKQHHHHSIYDKRYGTNHAK